MSEAVGGGGLGSRRDAETGSESAGIRYPSTTGRAVVSGHRPGRAELASAAHSARAVLLDSDPDAGLRRRDRGRLSESAMRVGHLSRLSELAI